MTRSILIYGKKVDDSLWRAELQRWPRWPWLPSSMSPVWRERWSCPEAMPTRTRTPPQRSLIPPPPMPTGRTLVYSTMIRVVVAQQTQVGVASATARFAAAPGNFAAIGAVGCWAIKTYRLYHSHYYGLTTTACLEMPTMQFLHEFKNRHFCTLSD